MSSESGSCSEGAKIYAHKIILATGSPFFDAMLTSGLHESMSSEVALGCSFAALQVIVRYLYSKEILFEGLLTTNFDVWYEVFQNARLMALPRLAKLALWFCYTLMKPRERHGPAPAMQGPELPWRDPYRSLRLFEETLRRLIVSLADPSVANIPGKPPKPKPHY